MVTITLTFKSHRDAGDPHLAEIISGLQSRALEYGVNLELKTQLRPTAEEAGPAIPQDGSQD